VQTALHPSTPIWPYSLQCSLRSVYPKINVEILRVEEDTMKFRFDPSVQALYIEVAPGEIARTVEFSENIYLDLDGQSNVIGIECLDISELYGLDIPNQIETAI
jgi:uncharacterized protein YuzE